MANNFRLAFNLSELSENISNENAGKLGIDFNKYFDKVLFEAMKKMDSDQNLNESCRVTRKQIRRPVLKNRYEFIQKLALKHKTSMSCVVELLLVKGLGCQTTP